MADKMILGEKYDEYMGFDCDNYDPYDPFADGPESDLFEKIEEAFGADAEAIITNIILGMSVDAAIQDMFI